MRHDDHIERMYTGEERSVFPESVKRGIEEERVRRARVELRWELERHGVVLPSEHPFSSLLNKIAERVGIDNTCQIWAVASDDPELAFYAPAAHVIVIGTGFIRHLEKGLKRVNRSVKEDHVASVLAVSGLVEDYIAAVMSHEGQHAYRELERGKGRSQRQKVIDSFKYLLAGHTEEMEADRVAMERMARAGYNPRAIVDVTRAFYQLIGFGEGLSHPAMVTRMNHLELILNDDEHPLINTDKDYRNLPLDFVSRLVEDERRFYKSTLELLSLSQEEVYERLLRTTSIENFVVLYKMYVHGEVVRLALRALEGNERIKRLAWRALICNRLFDAYEVFVEGKIIEAPVEGRKGPRELEIRRDDEKLPGPPEVLAENFRRKYKGSLQGVSVLGEDLRTEVERLENELDDEFNKFKVSWEKWVENFIESLSWHGVEISSFQELLELDEDLIKSRLQNLGDKELKSLCARMGVEDIDALLGKVKVARKYYSLLQAYELGEVPDEDSMSFLLKNLYPMRDKEVFGAFIDRYYQEEAEEEERVVNDVFYEEVEGGFVDFDDPAVQDLYRRSFEEAVAVRLIGEIFENGKWKPPRAVVVHLGDLICREFGLDIDPEIVGDLFLGFNALDRLEDVLLAEDEILRLLEINAYIKQLSDIRGLPKTNPQALAYFESLSDHFDPRNRRAYDVRYRSLLGLSSVVESSLVKKVMGKIRRQGKYIEPTEENIALFGVMYSLAHFTDSREVEGVCRTLAVYKLLNALKQGVEVEPSVVDVISDAPERVDSSVLNIGMDFEHVPDQLLLKPADVYLLLERLPWGIEYTQKYVFSFLYKMFEGRRWDFFSDYKELKEWLDVFQYFLDFIRRNPLPIEGKKGKWNRNYYQRVRLLKSIVRDLLTKRKQFYARLVEDFLEEEPYYEHGLLVNEWENDRFLRLLVKIGLVRNLSDILGFRSKDEVGDFGFLLYAPANQLLRLSDELKGMEHPGVYRDYPSEDLFSISEAMKLLSLIPPSEEQEVLFERRLIRSKRGLAIWSLSLGEVGTSVVEAVLDSYGDRASQWVLENLGPSFQRNKLLAEIALETGEWRDYRNYLDGLRESGWSPDTKYIRGYITAFSRNTAAFEYRRQYKVEGEEFGEDMLIATTHEEYEDIIRRRHPFKGIAVSVKELKGMEMRDDYGCQYPVECYEGGYDIRGNIEQRLIAEKLDEVKEELINIERSFKERVGLLETVCPVLSVVRDIHLERMIRVELGRSDISDEVKVKRGLKLLEMFASDAFTGFYASEVIRLKMKIDPNFFESFEEGLDFVVKLLPKASVKRNYFIDQVLEQSFVSPMDIERVEALRLTQELESQNESESYFYMAVLNHLLAGVNNREERSDLMLWLLGIKKQKPRIIITKEQSLKGKLDSMQNWFVSLTPYERRMVISRLLLGEVGVMDMSAAERFEGGIKRAKRIRDGFLEELISILVPDTVRGSQVIREIAIKALGDMSSSRAVTVLSEVINNFLDQAREGEAISGEAVVSDMLASMGIVGKKAAQSLAEQSWWVPEGFRRELKRSQESASRLSKRALWLLAVQEGLVREDSDLQIVGFGELLGAASNKQACEVLVRVNDKKLAEKLGLREGGEIEAVAKFKRPSALKSVILEEDLKAAERVMHFLQEQNVGVLPRGFVTRLRDVVREELKFGREVGYNALMGRILKQRKPWLGYKVTVPTILYASDNVIIETKARGVSLNRLREQVTVKELERVHAVLLAEVLYELLVSGYVHADLHPGNVFVDVDTKTVTLIDLGMHIDLDKRERRGVFKMLVGLILGKEGMVLNALMDGFGLSFEEGVSIDVQPILSVRERHVSSYQFAHNVRELLRFSSLYLDPSVFDQAAKLDKLFFALSKVTSYVEGLSPRLVVGILKELGRILVAERVSRHEGLVEVGKT